MHVTPSDPSSPPAARAVGTILLLGALASSVLVLLACAPAQPAAEPTPTTPPGPALRLTSACDLLTAEQVQRSVGSAPVTVTPSSVGTADFQGCFYKAGRKVVLDASFAKGLVGQDGQAAATEAAKTRAGGAIEPIGGLAAGAVYYPLGTGGSAVSLALDAGNRELVIVTLQGDLDRDILITLARQVDANV